MVVYVKIYAISGIVLIIGWGWMMGEINMVFTNSVRNFTPTFLDKKTGILK